MLSPADDISRFSRAQGAGAECAYDRALAELRAGRKRSHWIWFVLPQLHGLGRSATAQRYGLHGLGKAKAYLADPLLRQRLEEVIDVIHHQLQHPGQTLERLMGGELDATKTISSLTLFEAAGLASTTTLLNHLGRWRAPLYRSSASGRQRRGSRERLWQTTLRGPGWSELNSNAVPMPRIVIQWQDQFGHWQRFQEKHNQADAYRTAQARARSTGKRHRLVDEGGRLLDLLEP